eukprot:TRINITY_DN486_c0_g2_i1.p1 TRINITY_DN486_c0_g2~~TRINITY_DN486_c0_g2_i1.p1  ORF type:complete len:176 (+),score=25.75 TRINITY_DN486_c0_g2_i1:385-912(+)
MHLFSVAVTAIDTDFTSEDLINIITGNLGVDLLCHRFTSNKALSKLQREFHDPIIEWFEWQFGVKLDLAEVSKTVMFPPRHSPETKENVRKGLEKLSHWSLTGIELLSRFTKSSIISIALQYGAISIDEAVRASLIEAEAQTAEWGELTSHSLDRAYIDVNVAMSGLYLQLLKEN